jgi:hypothetical protein
MPAATAAVIFALAIFARVSLAQEGQSSASVPFVGCESDGQAGPLKAPSGKSPAMRIAPEEAQRLAYYKADPTLGVLAPRGWHCFGTYGSGGTTLYVSPDPIDAAKVLLSGSSSAGPAIELALKDGGTSGRFGVAQIIARVFPAHMDFANGVIAEGLVPVNTFQFGPYPADILTYKSDEVVEYQTPGYADGLGTYSGLKKNTSPINGVAILAGEELHLVLLSARLPSDLAGLAQTIVEQVERQSVSPR